MTRICLVIFAFLSIGMLQAEAQTSDLARIEYTYFPQSDSDNSFRRFRALINAPIKVKEGSYLVIGAEYRNVNLVYEDLTPFPTRDLERFQSYDLSLGYTFKMKNDWRFGVKTGTIIASNFTDGIKSDDLLFSGAVYFIKDKDMEDQPGTSKNWRLILGLRYSTTAGRPFPLPVINYNVRASEKWSYTLGVPKTNLKHYFSEKSIVQSFVTLDGFFANIQDNIDVDGNPTTKPADNISMTVVLAGLGYEYYLTDHLLLYAYAGYTLLNDIRMRNEDTDDVYTVNDSNTFYSRGGIKFKL
jgi:hypothetical protein